MGGEVLEVAMGSRPRAKARRHRAAVAAAALTVALLAAGAPSHATPVRYRDPIFDSVTVTEDLVYGQAPDYQGQPKDLKLDLYRPPASDTVTSRPAIIWAAGGGFVSVNKRGVSIVALATEFAKRGYVTASIDYRTRPTDIPSLIIGSLAGEPPPAIRDAYHDMQAAVRWFRANAGTYGVNPDVIVVGGHSAGGNMALEAAFNEEEQPEQGASDPTQSHEVSAGIALSASSDPRRIEMGDPPVAMFHGALDTTAPFPFTVTNCAATVALTNVCELTPYPLDGHNIDATQSPDIIVKTADFLCRRVIPGGC